MRILVVGSGGREHAICAAFARSSRVSKIFCANGNAGIAAIAECVDITPESVGEIADFASDNQIDLTFVGGETPLSLGIVDEFERRSLKIVGASKSAARLESSKSFAKDFMERHDIPTAQYKTAYSRAEAIEILEAGEFGDEETPVVVKADGLAAGKGVVVARDRADAIAAINGLEAVVGADAAATIVLEECLFGREVSLLMFVDGRDFALMPPTRDHKRIGEGDTGPNTGGMGAITDSSLLTEAQTQQIVQEIIEPTLKGCCEEGFPFRGILFLGLMMAEGRSLTVREGSNALREKALPDGQASAPEDTVPMLLEYNVRFGDPETQPILVRLTTDLVDICDAILAGRLSEMNIGWLPGSSACVVLASKGYPQKAQTGDVIHGLETASAREGIAVFHAGTAFLSVPPAVAGGAVSRSYVTAGGRVLGVTAVAENLSSALASAYEAVADISWDGMQYRKDIGK